MTKVTKYCPNCGKSPAQVELIEETCPDCGNQNLKSVFELACAVEIHKKFIDQIIFRINTLAMQKEDKRLEKIANDMRKFNNAG